MQTLIKQLSKINGVLHKYYCLLMFHLILSVNFTMLCFFPGCHTYKNISVWRNSNVINIKRIRRINSSVVNIFMPSLPDIMPLPLSYDKLFKYVCLKTINNYLHSGFFVYFRNKILTLIPSHEYSTKFSSNSSLILPALYKTVSHHQFLFTTVKL